MKKIFLPIMMFALACNTGQQQSSGADSATTTPEVAPVPAPVAAPVDTSASVPTGDNSMTSLDWPGTYKGTVPCADCAGIETTLTLDKDLNYTLNTKYLGKKDAPATRKGKFSWNAAGSTITLAGIQNAPSQYLVGENRLFQLDMQGQRITGGLASKYELIKQSQTDTAGGDITGIYWKLTELIGKSVDTTVNRKEMHLVLDQESGRVKGNGGCNNLSGTFTLLDGNRIKFSQMVSTRMACPAMQDESAFLQALAKSNTYIITGNELQLTANKMAPLLKFTAVKNKPE